MFVTDIGKRNWIDSANQKENYGKCDLFCDSFHYMLDNAWPWKDIGSVDETWRPNAAFIKCGLQTEFWICIIYRPRKHFLTIHFESVHTSNLCTPQWVVESSSIRNASVVNRKTNHSLFQLALNTFFSFSYQAFPPDFGAPWWSGQCPHQCPPPSRNSACAKVLLHFHKHIFFTHTPYLSTCVCSFWHGCTFEGAFQGRPGGRGLPGRRGTKSKAPLSPVLWNRG